MRAVGIASVASVLVALAAAQPMVEARDYNVVTKTVIATKYVDTTITVYPGQPTPHVEGGAKKSKPHHHGHHHHHPRPPHKPKHHKPAPKPAPKPAQAPPPPPPPAYTQPPPAPAAKPQPKPAAPKPAPAAPKPAAPKPKPAPAYHAPAKQPSPGGTQRVGEMTHYDPGMGSCGISSTGDEMIVALAVDVMNNGANPNANPLCGSTITIEYNGKQTKAKVVDTCQACASGDIDCSPSLFTAVAPNGDGRVPGVKWSLG